MLSSLNFVNAYDLSEYPSPFIKDGKFDGIIVVGDKAPANDVVAASEIMASLAYMVLGSAPKAILLQDMLLEKQTKTYTIKGLDYEVTLNSAADNGAQFIVNGQATNILSQDQSFKFADGTLIVLIDTFLEGNEYSAIFFLGEEQVIVQKTEVTVEDAKLASEVEDIQSINSILIGHACDNFLILEITGKENCKEGYERNAGSIETHKFSNGKVSIILSGFSPKDTLNAARILVNHGLYKDELKYDKVKVIVDNKLLKVVPFTSESKAESNKEGSYNASNLSLFIFVFLIVMLIILTFIKKSTKFKYSIRKR